MDDFAADDDYWVLKVQTVLPKKDYDDTRKITEYHYVLAVSHSIAHLKDESHRYWNNNHHSIDTIIAWQTLYRNNDTQYHTLKIEFPWGPNLTGYSIFTIEKVKFV